MRRLIVVPTAMGLIPPSFLLRAHKFAPKNIGLMYIGIISLSTKFVSLVSDSKSRFPASVAPIRCLKWPGLRPSGLPADPAGNERIADLTESEDTGIWSFSFSGACGRVTPIGATGCLSLSLFRVSLLSGANVSSEDSSRMAPLRSFSENLASTLFFRISSLGFRLVFCFLNGKGNSVGGKFEFRYVYIFYILERLTVFISGKNT